MDGEWLPELVPTFQWTGPKDVLEKFFKLFPSLVTPSESKIESVIYEVQITTASLTENRYYCPNNWLTRAQGLLKLGFPDLAAGDAFKALTLIRKVNGVTKLDEIGKKVLGNLERFVPSSGLEPSAATYARPQFKVYVHARENQIFLTLAQALFLSNCFIECIKIVKGYDEKNNFRRDEIKLLKDLAITAQSAEDIDRAEAGEHIGKNDLLGHEQRRSGTVAASYVYPWMAPYTGRDDATIGAAQEVVDQISNGLCILKRSTIRDHTLVEPSFVESTSHVLGIFACSDIDEGTIILVDRTSISGVDDSEQRCSSCRGKFEKLAYESKCCSAKFCGQTCLHQAVRLYHDPTCQETQVEDYLSLDREKCSSEKLAWLDILYRVLACAKEKPWSHPLKTPILSQMTAPAYSPEPVLFSFDTDIKLTFQMLEHLGINIYKDHGFDTWVLQAIQARLKNNVRDYTDQFDQYHYAANLSYAFFNHSCDPNVLVNPDINGSSTLRLITKKPVLKGEELFISYLDEEDIALPYEYRQVKLQQWTGLFCCCPKCLRERTGALNRFQKLFQYGILRSQEAQSFTEESMGP